MKGAQHRPELRQASPRQSCSLSRRFHGCPCSVVSVQSAPLAKVHRAFISRTAAEDTGVAIYNPSLNVPCQVEARLFDNNGNQAAGPVTLTLAARNQRAVFVTDASLFKTYIASLPGGFEGTMQLRVATGGPIAVLSLLQGSNNALVAVPVESETAPGP